MFFKKRAFMVARFNFDDVAAAEDFKRSTIDSRNIPKCRGAAKHVDK
jgi:hypothetical protein